MLDADPHVAPLGDLDHRTESKTTGGFEKAVVVGEEVRIGSQNFDSNVSGLNRERTDTKLSVFGAQVKVQAWIE